jgi:hypothetical protein
MPRLLATTVKRETGMSRLNPPILLIANRQNSALPISSDTPDSKSLKDQQLRS